MVEGRYGPSCAVAALSRHRGSESQASSRSSTPFQFPFPSFAGGFPGPLVVDPIGAEGTGRPGSSILSLLQQQGLIGSPPLSEDGRNSVGPLPTGLFRCTICLAAFPSAWLLEQHSNLQHSLQSMQEDGESGEEKPFRCDQCGQSYRYRSAYLKHREQNHRARLPADKLFTCDVCGMQFRYLKSFKKHRLNHALERLHAKPDLFNASRKFLAEPSSVDYSSKMLTMMMQGGRPNGDVLTSYGYSLDGCLVRAGCFGGPAGRVVEPAAGGVGAIGDQVSSSNEAVGSNAVEETPGTSFERSASVPVSKTEQHNFYKFSLDDYYYYGSGSNLAEGSGSKKKSDRLVMDSGDQDETIDSLAFALSMASNSGSGAGTAGEVFRSAQEASLLNLLRLDAAERQRERRFACPFCGKCVRSKENLKLHSLVSYTIHGGDPLYTNAGLADPPVDAPTCSLVTLAHTLDTPVLALGTPELISREPRTESLATAEHVYIGVVTAKGLESSISRVKRIQTPPDMSLSSPHTTSAPLIPQSSEKVAAYLLDKEGDRENKERSQGKQ
uniref:(California timema) hypothetical protein n=1 Tax=Timema californicum TaxID=61474 RepID=A0A7R9IWJ6_TIMCA|nr:unnamed protein product [Timema californicum]